MEKGKLIVSTKGRNMKTATLVQVIIYVVAFLIFFPQIIDSIDNGEESSVFLLMLVILAAFCAAMFAIMVEGRKSDSYLDVYEAGLLLRTAGSYTKLPEDVQLKYVDITNISVSGALGNLITIYTPYSQYQVSVQREKKPEQDLAIRAIQSRIGTEGKAIEEGEMVSEDEKKQYENDLKKQVKKQGLTMAIICAIVVAVMSAVLFYPVFFHKCNSCGKQMIGTKYYYTLGYRNGELCRFPLCEDCAIRVHGSSYSVFYR